MWRVPVVGGMSVKHGVAVDVIPAEAETHSWLVAYGR